MNSCIVICRSSINSTASIEVIKCLLKHGCNPNQQNIYGKTPLQQIGIYGSKMPKLTQQAIEILLDHNAPPPEDSWETVLDQEPPEAYTKLFLMGFPGTGKSTLAESIKIDAEARVESLTNRFKKVSNVPKDTSGIVPSDIHSKKFGLMTIYDLAGHSEFYACHDFALRNILAGSPSSIIFLVVDMRSDQDCLIKTFLYWCNFASNLFDCHQLIKPFLFIIGSHDDKVSAKSIEECKIYIENLKSKGIFSKFKLENLISLDCRYPGSVKMAELRSRISDCCQSIKRQQVINSQQHYFLVGIISEFKSKNAFTISEMITVANELPAHSYVRKFVLDMNQDIIVNICITLNKRGNILFLHNQSKPLDSWIVLKKDFLLKRICGSIFAPVYFNEHKAVASSTGIVSATKLANEFPDLDTELVISILSHLQFSHEVTDPEILKELSVTTTEMTKYLFFPSLVVVTIPQGVWDHQTCFTHQSVWIMKCQVDEQFLPSAFLHVTIHNLAFSHAMAPSSSASTKLSIERRCKVWKNGIFWRSLLGIDALVEVDCKSVAVYIRARKSCELDAVNLRSQLISRVLSVKSEYCKEVKVEEFLVKPESITFPLKCDAELVPMKELSHSISTCKPFVLDTTDNLVEIQNLLHFEVLVDLGESILCELFGQDSNCKITPEFLLRFADKLHHKMSTFVKVLDIPDSAIAVATENARPYNVDKFFRVLNYWQDRNPTYGELRRAITKYSVFAGRSPLNC